MIRCPASLVDSFSLTLIAVGNIQVHEIGSLNGKIFGKPEICDPVANFKSDSHSGKEDPPQVGPDDETGKLLPPSEASCPRYDCESSVSGSFGCHR